MFLASEHAAYITGASLSVDGGGAIPRRALTPV
jgi:NAD(P)-dependent dehydrogenase (short-subunit alcohol dehydrogenase family)